MLTSLKNLEDKLAQLIQLATQLRADNLALRDENQTLRHLNHGLYERMAQAQTQVDIVLAQLEASHAAQLHTENHNEH